MKKVSNWYALPDHPYKVQHTKATYIVPSYCLEHLGSRGGACALATSLYIGLIPCETIELLTERFILSYIGFSSI